MYASLSSGSGNPLAGPAFPPIALPLQQQQLAAARSPTPDHSSSVRIAQSNDEAPSTLPRSVDRGPPSVENSNNVSDVPIRQLDKFSMSWGRYDSWDDEVDFLVHEYHRCRRRFIIVTFGWFFAAVASSSMPSVRNKRSRFQQGVDVVGIVVVGIIAVVLTSFMVASFCRKHLSSSLRPLVVARLHELAAFVFCLVVLCYFSVSVASNHDTCNYLIDNGTPDVVVPRRAHTTHRWTTPIHLHPVRQRALLPPCRLLPSSWEVEYRPPRHTGDDYRCASYFRIGDQVVL